MKKLKIMSIILIFIAFLFIYQSNVFCMSQIENTQIKSIKLAAGTTADDIMSEADDFISQGESSYELNDEALRETSNFLYNLLLGIGIIVAVAVGIVLGIKYMTGSIEEKADLKQALLGYVVSCVVIFGAFGIWRLAVNIFSNI